ncbi:hypothetical protein LINPERHAP2_LOCUS38600 [Linum perenne]
MSMCSTLTITSETLPFVPFTTTFSLTDLSSLESTSILLTLANMAFTLIVSLPILVGALLLFLDPSLAIPMPSTSFTPIFVLRVISIEVSSAHSWMVTSSTLLPIFCTGFLVFLG